jgi:putative DNA primase/helicase
MSSPGATGCAEAGNGLSDEVLLEKARSAANREKFCRLFDKGDLSEYQDDHSRADKALVNLLAFWTCKNAVQMDRLFRQSKLMRAKWDERRGDSTYGQLEIEEAIDFVENSYDPKPCRPCTQAGSSPSCFRLTDVGNAQRLVASHGQDLRYVHAWRSWLVWDGQRWRPDETGEIMRRAKNTIAQMFRQGAATAQELADELDDQ